jgi:hypothetical protein
MYLSHKPPCNKTYFNYASYMNTRNCEQQICKIVSAIENGTILPHFLTHGGVINGPVTLTDSVTITGGLHVDGALSFSGDTYFSSLRSETLELYGPAPKLVVDTSAATPPTLTSLVTIVNPVIEGSDMCGSIAYDSWDASATLTVTYSGAAVVAPLVHITGVGTEGSIQMDTSDGNGFSLTNFGAALGGGAVNYLVIRRA